RKYCGALPEGTPMPAGDDEVLLAAQQVCSRLGGISLMTLGRWLSSDVVRFPQPIPRELSARLGRLGRVKGNYNARDPSIKWFELATVRVGNGADAGEWFMVGGGDTVAVAVPWALTPANPIVPTDDDKAKTKRQRVRDIVATAMPTDCYPIKDVVPAVEKE